LILIDLINEKRILEVFVHSRTILYLTGRRVDSLFVSSVELVNPEVLYFDVSPLILPFVVDSNAFLNIPTRLNDGRSV